MITVDEMMTENPRGLAETATLDEALAMMEKYSCHHVPVVNDTNELVGLVTHRDMLGALGSTLNPEDRVNTNTITLGEIMTTDVFTVAPQTNLRKAAMYVRSQRYGCLPVVENGKLVGIITDSDFVNIAIDLLEQVEDAEPQELEAAG
jgi:CBS domain-containing protein